MRVFVLVLIQVLLVQNAFSLQSVNISNEGISAIPFDIVITKEYDFFYGGVKQDRKSADLLEFLFFAQSTGKNRTKPWDCEVDETYCKSWHKYWVMRFNDGFGIEIDNEGWMFTVEMLARSEAKGAANKAETEKNIALRKIDEEYSEQLQISTLITDELRGRFKILLDMCIEEFSFSQINRGEIEQIGQTLSEQRSSQIEALRNQALQSRDERRAIEEVSQQILERDGQDYFHFFKARLVIGWNEINIPIYEIYIESQRANIEYIVTQTQKQENLHVQGDKSIKNKKEQSVEEYRTAKLNNLKTLETSSLKTNEAFLERCKLVIKSLKTTGKYPDKFDDEYHDKHSDTLDEIKADESF